MLILIDNGHGHNTPGKRSPDGKFLEATYTREIARRVVADLIALASFLQTRAAIPFSIMNAKRVYDMISLSPLHEYSTAETEGQA